VATKNATAASRISVVLCPSSPKRGKKVSYAAGERLGMTNRDRTKL
jgi:hypothetical protein